jgi:Zn-dependent protease
MGRAFGLAPRIDLHGMGGTTSWTSARGELTTTKSVLISVAGPGVGILVGALVKVLLIAGVLPPNDLVQQIAHDMVWVNAGWGFVNLLPVLPMDGGNVLFTVLNAATRGKGERPARMISIATALLGGIVAFGVYRMWWPAVLAALFAYDNLRALRALAAAQSAQGVLR